MPPGKLASQAGHAFLDSYLAALSDAPDRVTAYGAPGAGTKVVASSDSLGELLRARDFALEAGIPCALVTDSGHVLPPYFTGEPIITALGLGPATRAEVRRITGSFALVP
jgi:peptidyl-tRNA hydrolase